MLRLDSVPGIAVLVCLLGTAMPVHADFELCNQGTKDTIYVADANQADSIFPHPYSLGAWTVLAPGECYTRATGNVSGRTFWLHAEVHGLVLTADYAKDVFVGERKFCVTDGAMTDDSAHSVADESECPGGTRIASFPIYARTEYRDLTVNFDADDIDSRAPARPNHGREYLPSQFGAIVFDHDRTWWATYLRKSAESARTTALDECRQGSSAPDSCSLALEFADQCIVVMYGNKDPVYLAAANRGSDKNAARAWAQKRCAARGNTECKESQTLCSTSAEQIEQTEQRRDEMTNKVLEGMAGALKEIWKK